jgi:hypothetical protein
VTHTVRREIHFTSMMAGLQPTHTLPQHITLMKRRFTPAEDAAINHLVQTVGRRNWDQIARLIPDRTPRQCRERYENYLADVVSTSPWTTNDDQRLLQMVNNCGHQWTEMAKYFPGRSPNNLKNRWHKVLSKVPLSSSIGPDSPSGTDLIDQTHEFVDVSYDNWDTLGNAMDDCSSEWPCDDISTL